MNITKNEIIVLTLITGESLIGTVSKVFSDGAITVEDTKFITVGPNGEVLLDRFQYFSASETYTFPHHAILTTNKPVSDLEAFYKNFGEEGHAKQVMIVEQQSDSVH